MAEELRVMPCPKRKKPEPGRDLRRPRASSAQDETRRFFNTLRDSWVRAANNHQLAESLEADVKAPEPNWMRRIGIGRGAKPKR
jgi:hypothetical protein